MAHVGPFEPQPSLAVGCSGGPDSMALTLCLHDWAAACGGRLTALVIDHGLRAEAAAEAARTVGWLTARGIAAMVLRVDADALHGNLAAAARAARMALLTAWCARRGILHLFLAHHREDQAETLLLRLGRGSGVDGLSGMAPVAEGASVRVLRPLLSVPRARLRATLACAGQDFVEDPSNDDPAFARARVRALAPRLAAEGMSAARLAATARRLARARAALERQATAALADGAILWPEGYAELRLDFFHGLDMEVGLRCLSRLLQCIGGGIYPARLERVERLHAALRCGSRSRTLAGCRIVPGRGRLLICREPAAATEVMPLEGNGSAGRAWDGRFRFETATDAAGVVPAGLSNGAVVRRLGQDGWRRAKRLETVAGPLAVLPAPLLPAPVRPALPAVWSADGDLLGVPHLGFVAAGRDAAAVALLRPIFAPARPLGEAGFTFE